MSRYRLHEGSSWSSLIPHVKVLYVLQMLVHVSRLVGRDSQALIDARIAELVDWWSNAVPTLSDDELAPIFAALQDNQDGQLTQLLLTRSLTGMVTLERARAWMEAHAKSWEACATNEAAVVASLRTELARRAGS
jgi:hypothetical protein